MERFTGFMKDLWQNEEGQGLVEYGLILALVAIVSMFALYTLGGTVEDNFTDVNTQLTTPASTP